MSSPADRAAARGFTLIEVMVALAVFGLAVLALVRLESATARAAGQIDATLLAQMVADTLAAEAVTDAQPPTLGRSDGIAANGGRQWRWSRTVSRLGDGGALRIDVAVASAARQTLGRTTAVRPPDPPQVVAS